MGQTVSLTGIILQAAPAGEFDKRLTILTRERGKITAFARGARRPKNALQAAANLFCFGTFEAYEGRETFTVIRADIKNYFRELSADYDATCYGCYFLELADYFTQPYNESDQQLTLLYQTLRALQTESIPNSLIRSVYELRTLVIYGVTPQVFSCVNCNKQVPLPVFSLPKRGCLCADCAAGIYGISLQENQMSATSRKGTLFPLSETALYALQYIITTPLPKLYTFTLSKEVHDAIQCVISAYLSAYVDRTLKTAIFLPET